MNTTNWPSTYRGHDAHTGEQYLLTVYPDGHREIATRSHSGATWRPPVALAPFTHEGAA